MVVDRLICLLRRPGWLGVFLLLLAGCIATPTSFQVATPTLASVPSPVVSENTTPSQPVDCAYVLSSKDLPDVAQKVNQAIRSANLTNVAVRAAAYGENCLDTNTNQVVRFSTMQTDLYFTVPVQDPQDTQFMGNWISQILPVIAQLPAGDLPGPNPGNIAVQFTNSSGNVNLWFSRKMADELLNKGVRGSALYQALLDSPAQ